MAQGGMSCIKYILGVFNLAFFLSSIGIIALCSQALGMQSSLEKILDLNTVYLVGIIVAAVMLLILSFLGCCGALRENHCMLISYGTLLMLIMIVEIALGVLVILYRYKVETYATEGMNKFLDKYEFGGNNTETLIIDDLQLNIKCCGAQNVSDWTAKQGGKIPESCCGHLPAKSVDNSTITTTAPEECTADKAFKKGCVAAISDIITTYANPVAGVLLTVGVVQLLGVIMACVFASSIKGGYQVV
ncbi:CD63 antigen-like [Brevipalpus obovatus]|uniref:CD63 antigen-like n=1 Tax=Brevipalpus obovatus TaxID=246614 RepID=UPI003D9DEABC